MYGLLFLLIHVFIQTAISSPCNDYVLTCKPIEEILEKLNRNSKGNGPGISNSLPADGAKTDIALPKPRSFPFSGPIRASGKLGNTSGFKRPFPSPFRPPNFKYPPVNLPKLTTLPAVCVPPPASKPSQPIPEFKEPFLKKPNALFEAHPKPVNLHIIDISKSGPPIEALTMIIPLGTSEPIKILDPKTLGSESPFTIPTNIEIPIIEPIPIPEVPKVRFNKFKPNIDYISKNIKKPFAEMEAKIEKILAKLLRRKIRVQKPVEHDTKLDKDDPKVGLPVQGKMKFNGPLSAAGSYTIAHGYPNVLPNGTPQFTNNNARGLPNGMQNRSPGFEPTLGNNPNLANCGRTNMANMNANNAMTVPNNNFGANVGCMANRMANNVANLATPNPTNNAIGTNWVNANIANPNMILANKVNDIANSNGGPRVTAYNLAITSDASNPDMCFRISAEELKVAGTVTVNGYLPLSGTISINGNVPSDGSASVNYSSGNM